VPDDRSYLSGGQLFRKSGHVALAIFNDARHLGRAHILDLASGEIIGVSVAALWRVCTAVAAMATRAMGSIQRRKLRCIRLRHFGGCRRSWDQSKTPYRQKKRNRYDLKNTFHISYKITDFARTDKRYR